MNFEKLIMMNTHSAPQFLVFPKRRNSKEPFASLYVRIIFEKKNHEKSINIKCPYENWDGEKMTIKDYPG
jgi:hypothetical protein